MIYDLGRTEIGKKRRLEETIEYCEGLVNLKPRLRYRPCWG